MFPALKQKLGGHRFKGVCEIEMLGTCWMMVQNPGFHQQEIENLIS
jgi:hypothetical protein